MERTPNPPTVVLPKSIHDHRIIIFPVLPQPRDQSRRIAVTSFRGSERMTAKRKLADPWIIRVVQTHHFNYMSRCLVHGRKLLHALDWATSLRIYRTDGM